MTLPIELNESSYNKRIYFIDYLRAFVIVLVIVLHASMTYMISPPEWWYVIEPKNNLVFSILVLLLDVPNMQILFFIAGFFAYDSLEKYGTFRFLKQKFMRIGLPWLFGVFFLAPISAYLTTVTRGNAKPFLEFWLFDFWGSAFQQSSYWFLGMLLLLFLLFAFIINIKASWPQMERQDVKPSWMFLIKFLTAMSLWTFLSSIFFPPDSWLSSLKVFVFQPTRLLLYFGYFGLGIYADRKGWLREKGYQPSLIQWLPISLVSASAYLAFHLFWVGGNFWLQLVLHAVLFNLFCLSGLIASLAVFRWIFFDRPHPLWSSLSRNSFAIYYVHPLILYTAAYLMLFVNISIFIEAALLIVFTIIVSWAFSALILTRSPVLRNFF